MNIARCGTLFHCKHLVHIEINEQLEVKAQNFLLVHSFKLKHWYYRGQGQHYIALKEYIRTIS